MADFCTKIQKLGKGIGSPSRYRILQELMNGEKTVNELVAVAKLSQPAVSQHLSTLKQCGLVESVKRGQEVYYSIDVKYTLEVLRRLTLGIAQCPKKSAISK